MRYRPESVILDVDGVLANFAASYSGLAHEMFGLPRRASHDECATWDDFGSMTAEQEEQIWRVIRDPGSRFWLFMTPLVGPRTWRRIDRFSERVPLYFVTNRVGATAKQQTERWLSAHLTGLASVIVTGQKGRIALGVGAQWALDDKPSNVVDMGRHCLSYVLSRPYNADFACQTRVASVDEFLDVVEAG